MLPVQKNQISYPGNNCALYDEHFKFINLCLLDYVRKLKEKWE